MSTAPARVCLACQPGADVPRRSLVLAGNGLRVAYQAGALVALEEAGLGFEHIDGTSAGAMNLAMLLSGLTPDQMCDRWRSLSARDLVGSMPALLSRLGVDVARINAASGLVGTFNVGNLTTRTNVAVAHRELSDALLLAAITPPGLVPPVEIEGAQYADAVWIQNANVFEALRRGAEEIWLVWCLGRASRQRVGTMPSYDQLLEMAACGGLSATFRHVAELNERILGGDSPYGQRAPVRFKIIRPDYPLPFESGDERGGVDGTTLVHLGYADAWRRLSEREANDALDVAPLRVATSESALALDERFGGSLTAEPAYVAREGLESTLISIELALSIFVHELGPFIEDPSRAAPLAGTLGYAQASLGLRHGLVRCELDPQTGKRRLVYEASFQPRGASGPLRLRLLRQLPGTGPALLREVTTLQAVVFDGVTPDAPVAARGELETSEEDLTASCRALHAIEPGLPRESARAIVQLGRFLYGELYDAYTARPWWKVW
jgi:hypothetical protein